MNLLKLSKNHFDKLYNEDIAEYKYDFGYIIDYICLPIVDSIIMSCSIDENNTITHNPEKYSNNYRIYIDHSYFNEDDNGNINYSKIECKDIHFIQTDELSYPIDNMPHYVWEPSGYFEYDNRELKNSLAGEYEKPLLKSPQFRYFRDGQYHYRINGQYGTYNFKEFSKQCIDDYKIHLNKLYDATRGIRLNYLYEIIRHFDSPIGHFMVNTNRRCFQKYKSRLTEIQNNRNKLDENQLKILKQIETIINKIIKIDNIYDITRINLVVSNNTILDYRYPDKDDANFIEYELVDYHYFIKDCFIKFRNMTNNDVNEQFRYIYQLYLYMNLPLCVYWANRYNIEYEFIRDEIIEKISANLDEFDVHQKEIIKNIYNKIRIIPYKTKDNIEKIKVLQSFCRRNYKYFKFNKYIKSKEFNEWFYHPNNIGGKMHMRHSLNLFTKQ
jgi:hypothetical protein